MKNRVNLHQAQYRDNVMSVKQINNELWNIMRKQDTKMTSVNTIMKKKKKLIGVQSIRNCDLFSSDCWPYEGMQAKILKSH